MRIRSQLQQYFKPQSLSTTVSLELEEASKLLESLPEYREILNCILRDLNPGKDSLVGRPGMTAEQVFRAYILKGRHNCSYRKLSELTDDSISAREFMKIAPFKAGFDFKTLHGNISSISESTIDFINDALKNYSLLEGIEDGNITRTDATTIETNIHHPTDWSLMHDCIRVLSRIMTRLFELHGVPIVFQNHYRASKKKLFKIHNTRSSKKHRKLNMELIRLCSKTIGYANEALPVIDGHLYTGDVDSVVQYNALIAELRRINPLAEKIVNVAHRRIVLNENVPSNEKVVSIFEPHTDIIVKGKRQVVFGHKATITTGKSGIITDVIVHDGNPADSTIVPDVLMRHKDFFTTPPKSMVFDGCYYSDDNRTLLENAGVENVCFSKEPEEKTTCSRVVRKMLRFFRAGIEASVSILKRMFGWDRVLDKGKEHFQKAIKTGVLVYNLFILSRIKLRA
jgi:transposase, IS5 family